MCIVRRTRTLSVNRYSSRFRHLTCSYCSPHVVPTAALVILKTLTATGATYSIQEEGSSSTTFYVSFWKCYKNSRFMLQMIIIIISRVGVYVTNNEFWIGWLDLLVLLVQFQSITVTYNSSLPVTASGSFHFLPGLRASSLPLWLAS
jgi:hypothetical protein